MPQAVPALLLSLTFLQVSQPATPSRDGSQRTIPATGTAVIRGRVTDRATGRAVARALVRINLLGPPATQLQTFTTADGRYEFARLGAGPYALTADRPLNSGVFLSQAYGDDRPLTPYRNGTRKTIELKDGETFEANLAMWRALAIDGRVLDEDGEPLANVRVHAVPVTAPAVVAHSWRTTDDRGAFRLFGLGPGDFRVCAEPDDGTIALRFASAAPGERAVKTCYPSVRSESDATIVALATEDLTGVEIRVARGRAYRMSGIVVDASGLPLGGGVSLVRRDGAAIRSSSGITVKEGRFSAEGLVPGDYAIRAEIGGRVSWPETREQEFAFVPVRVDAADVDGLVVQTAKGVTINGRIDFEEGAPATRPVVNVNVRSQPEFTIGGFHQPVRVDGNTFRLDGVFGPNAIQVFGAMRPWVVKAINYRGEDIFGRMVEFKGSTDPDELVVVLTNRPATITGRVELAATTSRPNGIVLLMPADPARREPSAGTVFSAAIDVDGSFRLPPVRPGEYVIVAVDGDDAPVGSMLREPGAYDRLAAVAEPIALGQDDRRSIVLKLVKPRR
jgi:hypothetical protein